jgi:hypothetical protein
VTKAKKRLPLILSAASFRYLVAFCMVFAGLADIFENALKKLKNF